MSDGKTVLADQMYRGRCLASQIFGNKNPDFADSGVSGPLYRYKRQSIQDHNYLSQSGN